jgi:hypothetical protein
MPVQKARLDKNLATGGYDVHVLTRRRPSGDMEMLCPLAPLAFMHMTPGTLVPGPAFQLSYESAQNLFDALWEVGVRPSSGVGQQDSAKTDLAITLMKDHLADLRRALWGQDQNRTADQPATAPSY